MGIKELLSKIHLFKQKLNTLYSVERTKRDIIGNEQVKHLSNEYKKSLNEIKFGKINSTYKSNLFEIEQAKNYINKQQYFNLKFNNKIAGLRDKHPVFYIVKENKIYFMVQTNQKHQYPSLYKMN